GLHPLQVKGIADGDVDMGIKGLDPVANGQLSRAEIETGEKDPSHHLRMENVATDVPEPKARRRPKYTPVSKRQERPDAIYWLLRNHPELSDSQIQKLVGTTKSTIESIRNRTHWNAANIKPVDPVSLGLCSQIDLDDAVKKAADKKAREEAKAGGAGQTLKPVSETVQPSAAVVRPSPKPAEQPKEEEKELTAESVFARLKSSPEQSSGSE
ncbi:MAG TPA: DUF1013 domain-containing protein, partial [Alphaproteobacteria bacterium]|nr:DUF1013 domain-containing protein [Alphaproteobacteria bacterium]